jgi:hypothetical protein
VNNKKSISIPRLLAQFVLVAFLSVVFLSPAVAQPVRTFSHPDRIRYDNQCLTIDGKDIFIYSGAFHYFRCPKELWPDRFQKIKDAGFNTVETYVPWNWCEQQMPSSTNDFSKVNLKDLDDWLTMAEQYGFYVIVRPGPYICSEWDTGGFPQWLLTKKPEQPLRSEGWLRSDDPVYLAWSKHWYDAVCPVIAKHQITRKAPGSRGVILFQVENEYDFGPKFSDDVKINQVKALAQYAWADGIDVPLISCWTHQVRGSTDPVVRQIFDFCNFYPRWKVLDTLPEMQKLRREQPDAPLGTTELQGGWFAQVGGKLSEDQDGVTALQINNLTLFVIQNGETILNYYMLFGGTNPDDWTARDLPTTYDYNAPIRECGGVGDRYQRVWALGHMLQEHGGDLVRSSKVDCNVTTTQNDVAVVERRAPDGGRYFFIRTSQHQEPRQGTATVQETNSTSAITFNYDLEPFGAKVLYLPPGVNSAEQGEWLPKEAPPIARPDNIPAGVTITSAKMRVDPGPEHWKALKAGENLAQAGVYDSHFIFYRADASCTSNTDLQVNYPKGDEVLAAINDTPASRTGGGKADSTFGLMAGKNAVQLLYENHGHANIRAPMENPCGVLSASTGGQPDVLLSYGRPGGDERLWWKPGLRESKWMTVAIGQGDAPANSLLTWYRMDFALPAPQSGAWVPWRLHLMASGNGFLYLNGHPIGRYWDVGPQHDFFLPENWLHFGAGQANNLTLDLRPTKNGAGIQSAVVEPYAQFAEKR